MPLGAIARSRAFRGHAVPVLSSDPTARSPVRDFCGSARVSLGKEEVRCRGWKLFRRPPSLVAVSLLLGGCATHPVTLHRAGGPEQRVSVGDPRAASPLSWTPQRKVWRPSRIRSWLSLQDLPHESAGRHTRSPPRLSRKLHNLRAWGDGNTLDRDIEIRIRSRIREKLSGILVTTA